LDVVNECLINTIDNHFLGFGCTELHVVVDVTVLLAPFSVCSTVVLDIHRIPGSSPSPGTEVDWILAALLVCVLICCSVLRAI